jgi:uncharacterized RDD family membrane protein YckC
MATIPYTAPAAAGLEGHYAGIVSRLGAFTIDVVVIAAVFSIAGTVVEYVLAVLMRHPMHLSDAGWFSNVALVVWAAVYYAYPQSVSGRTLGMAIVGLRAVRADGSELRARQAVLRTVCLPLSFLFLGIGFLLSVLRGDRRALHDLLGGSAVVYAWDARAARLRFLARR